MANHDPARAAQATQRTSATRPHFLDDFRIKFGPHQLLGRFFLAADEALQKLGIRLQTSSLNELAELQAAHGDSWPLFAPMLDPRLGGVDPASSYGFVGIDATGAVACAQGGRIYNTGTRSLQSIVDDQSFFIGSSAPREGQPRCSTTAPIAQSVAGCFTYSGALWVHPKHRGHQLAALLPRVSRAYALSRWDANHTIAVVSTQIAASPLMAMYGYQISQPEFRITNVGPKDYVGQLMVLTADELLQDLAVFMSTKLAQVDATVAHGGAQDELLPTRQANG